MTTAPPIAAETGTGPGAVFANRPFLLLWLAQAATQIGGNMVLYGLTVVVSANNPNSAVSALILTFLVPAVVLSAVAGVYVDRLDRRIILIVTNALRAVAIAAMFFAGDHLLALLVLNIFVSSVTVFFAPAEAAMIPFLVPRSQLLAANGIFTLTLNAAFALGFALVGPLVVTIFGAPALILIVAALYLVAAAFCWTLPPGPPPARAEDDETGPTSAVADAERAVGSMLEQLRDGLGFIRSNRTITWSLIYLGIAASLVGVLGVLGPDFAETTLGLDEKDFVVIVLPLGVGIVMGILLLNSYGKFLPRRRVIESGLVGLGALLALLSVSGPISLFLRRTDASAGFVDLSAVTSLLAVVVVIAFLAGIAYALVAIPAQTQLQEDLPEEVRGRVFGVLNMLVSVSSFLPIILVGPISDLLGTGTVFLAVALLIGASGIASIVKRGPLQASESMSTAEAMVPGAALEPIGVMTHADPAPYDDDISNDRDAAAWMRAAGWGRSRKSRISKVIAAVTPNGTAAPPTEPPSEQISADPAVQSPARLPADPLGLVPDDPAALALAQTQDLAMPRATDPSVGGIAGPGTATGGPPTTEGRGQELGERDRDGG